MVKKTADEIQAALPHFNGTEHYYRYSPMLFPRVVLTDGAKYIAEACEAYWLMDAIASHLTSVPAGERLVLATLTRKDRGATLMLSDDTPPTKVYAEQDIEYTDFPLDLIKFFVARQGADWIVLLPGEY